MPIRKLSFIVIVVINSLFHFSINNHLIRYLLIIINLPSIFEYGKAIAKYY